MGIDLDKVRRARWRAYCQATAEIGAAWRARGYGHPPPAFPALPEDLQGLTCGAKTRAGTPCKQTSIYENGRCKLHGGLSTGPTSDAGRARAAMNGFRPKAKRSP